MHRSKHRGNRPAVGGAVHRGALGPRRVHHHPNVVGLLLDRRPSSGHDPVRETRAATIEDDEPSETRAAFLKTRDRRLLPSRFETVQQSRHLHKIDRTLAHDLIRDPQVAAAGVKRIRRLHTTETTTPPERLHQNAVRAV